MPAQRSFITASRIAERLCSPSRDGQELLPQLVEKLITASISKSNIRHIRFPHGDQIYLHGGDGSLAIDPQVQHFIVPDGLSLWEMGTSTDPKGKADDDFEGAEQKLKKAFPKVPEIEPKDATFVFVTSKSWESGQWIQARSNSSWKDIRVIDAVDLAKWLEQCPAVLLWFAKECGLPAEGLYDIKQYLEKQENCLGISTLPELILGGREKQIEKMLILATQDKQSFHIQGESPEEAAIFIASVWAKKEDKLSELSPLIFADYRANLDLLATYCVEMNLVPLDSETHKKIKGLKQSEWRLILPEVTSNNSSETQNRISLEKINRTTIEQYLSEKTAIPEHKVRQFARESKGSLAALSWLIGSKDSSDTPRWACRKDATTHASLILLGSWIGSNNNDTAMVERISQKGYRDIETLLQSASLPEGPWVHQGTEWLCASKDFVWSQLSGRITETMLKDFREMVCEVIGEPNPSMDLPVSERYMAGLLGKVRKYSPQLRKGLVDSLARLAMTRSDGQGWADQIIHNLLDSSQPDPEKRWLSQADIYPGLAEAAPDIFLSCLEDFMKQHATVFFQGTDDTLFAPTSAHTYLLWALERLAWVPKYFPRVLSILATLSEVDPGGKTANRPLDTLRNILLPWCPQHNESLSKSASAMDMLYRNTPEIAWSVGIGLLPVSHGISMPTSKPNYRHIAEARDVTDKDYWNFIRTVVEKLIGWAGSDAKRLAEIIEVYPELQSRSSEVGGLIINAIADVNTTLLDEEEKSIIESGLRKTISFHREYSYTDWALSAGDVERLEKLRRSFVSSDLVLRYKYLFTWEPKIPNSPMKPYADGWDEWIYSEQKKAVQLIFSKEGLTGLLRLTEVVKQPDFVGRAMMACSIEDETLRQIINGPLSESPEHYNQSPKLQCVRAYFFSMCRNDSEKWLERVLNMEGIEWSPAQYVNVALTALPGPSLWSKLTQWGSETEALYWKNVSLWRTCLDQWPIILEKWEEVQRPWSALTFLADVISERHPHEIEVKPDADQVMTVLETAVTAAPNVEPAQRMGSLIPRQVERLFKYLDTINADTTRLARLEWLWLRILENTSRGVTVLLHGVLSSPEFFVELLEIMYRAEDETVPETPDDNRKLQAEQAFRLLQKINTIPGADLNGNINEDKLYTWIVKSRELANTVKRGGVCDTQIGEILSNSPESPDGSWPSYEVRILLEEIQNSEIERGIYIGKLNQRGAIMRGPGGQQERELANKFKAYADKVRTEWPRSAVILDMLVEHYERDAQRWDEQDKWEEYE